MPLLTSTDWWSGTQIALRHVFEQDSDFKERMFARQIAVMKGQAWNVVETLKIEDHGPLELTRRTRVCVWDDLVDIPVAIPLRTPPAHIQRYREAAFSPQDELEEEMDISAANGPLKPRGDLLNFSPPPSELPNPNRFELSRNPSDNGDLAQLSDVAGSPATIGGETFGYGSTDAKDFAKGTQARPAPLRARTRPSFDGAARHRASSSVTSRGGGFSFSSRRGMFYDETDEGDLGYAAARVTEKNTRKVIVERLETVKSKNPFFTWC